MIKLVCIGAYFEIVKYVGRKIDILNAYQKREIKGEVENIG